MQLVAVTDEMSAPNRPATLFVCRCLDVLLAGAGILVLAPLFTIATIAIRLERNGPAIFSQRRLGRNKQAFTVHKFRTMTLAADSAVHREYVAQLIAGVESSHKAENGRDLYKLAADDRITRVGCFLRRTSLDELPQLFDVLRGRMSLVGPRPVIPYEADLYPSDYDKRFAVKPGLTGLWQVSGRCERTYREMIELDLAWVERHSVRLYLSILVRTPIVMLRQQGAA
jgi:lipopolysaccharide/colanic/teichoic acid biosynthesis glycosyltransferase